MNDEEVFIVSKAEIIKAAIDAVDTCLGRENTQKLKLKTAYLVGFEDAARLVADGFDISAILD